MVAVSSSTQEQLPVEPPGVGQLSRSLRDAGFVLLAVFLLAVLLLGVTYGVHWLRTSRRNQKRPRVFPENSEPSVAGRLPYPARRRRRRRSRRANLSLAETRGLPPKRPNPSR